VLDTTAAVGAISPYNSDFIRNVPNKLLRKVLLNWNSSESSSISSILPINVLQSVRIASFLRNESIYFPHSIDFRGRAYPTPQALNHMNGGDIGRALLMFGSGKPLGEHGLKFLKLQLANLYGNIGAGSSTKQSGTSSGGGSAASPSVGLGSIEAKIAFVDKHLEDIMHSARDPWGLSGTSTGTQGGSGTRGGTHPQGMWWMKAKQPFQALACCIELNNALESSTPGSYISHLPVHQDGSCNGLQHYAALTRSVPEGLAVNLLSKNEFISNYSSKLSIE